MCPHASRVQTPNEALSLRPRRRFAEDPGSRKRTPRAPLEFSGRPGYAVLELIQYILDGIPGSSAARAAVEAAYVVAVEVGEFHRILDYAQETATSADDLGKRLAVAHSRRAAAPRQIRDALDLLSRDEQDEGLLILVDGRDQGALQEIRGILSSRVVVAVVGGGDWHCCPNSYGFPDGPPADPGCPCGGHLYRHTHQ